MALRLPTRGPCSSRLFVAALFLSLLMGPGAVAAKTRNAAILARVLSYELTLDERVGPSVGVAVLYKRGDKVSEANADDWFQALSALASVKIKDRQFFAVKIPYSVNDVMDAIQVKGVDVLLISDGLTGETDEIVRLARARHILTASNNVSSVEGKNVTLCVMEEVEKTKIVINLSSAQQEGIRFSSNLLKLATIIR
jgi:hypothetical protein